ncbi:hypothetical protein PC118_g2342 [Phytophthora cactorum]|uniref:Uncharacterized protein n=1 Tax=Phytophthora cactorum TaxID=29920 RepID=A0A8T1EFQ1_9STRA|nr:hypothetical protein PC117_g2972 [Phytophthora cactorum]KAG2996618.1 hypothetical protein PC118_g2342 [Phytophthora cactorum]KAG3036500.1 hypothetical protein PC120_g262 [Phytophthora cactorum]KAG3038893.1 hypothetical protein PC119_g2553 [Phytophthora cactorum]KAG3165785.1 hypothetical protein PC128_g19855 [Phytophthora cactorum]
MSRCVRLVLREVHKAAHQSPTGRHGGLVRISYDLPQTVVEEGARQGNMDILELLLAHDAGYQDGEDLLIKKWKEVAENIAIVAKPVQQSIRNTNVVHWSRGSFVRAATVRSLRELIPSFEFHVPTDYDSVWAANEISMR